jgi:DNA-binding NtrC family response regulator
MTQLLSTLARVAPADVPLLIVGEPGAGLTRLAHHVHGLSGRSRLTEIHCPSQPPEHVEAFTGGTLILDEVGALHPSLQARVARLLAKQPPPVRVIATSHHDLRTDSRFHHDLFSLLSTVELRVPPLREPPPRPPPPGAPYLGGDFTLEEIERAHLLAVVDRHRRFDEAAAVLGIDTSTLWRKRKKLGP